MLAGACLLLTHGNNALTELICVRLYAAGAHHLLNLLRTDGFTCNAHLCKRLHYGSANGRLVPLCLTKQLRPTFRRHLRLG